MKQMLVLVVTIGLAVFLIGCETTDSSGSHASHGSSSGAGGCH